MITSKVRRLLSGDLAGGDKQIEAVLAILDYKNAGEDWHKHGTFKDHLTGVYRILSLWNQPLDVRLCGLLHSVYSNEYVDLALFGKNHGRNDLRNLVGDDTEELVFTFCTMPRTQFTINLLEADEPLRTGMTLRRNADGALIHLSPEQVGKFLVISLADLAEQLFGWQDEVMAGYPYLQKLSSSEHWAAALWPGPFRPSGMVTGLLSRLARHVPYLPVTVPPIFNSCTAVVSEADVSAAMALYWQVATQGGPLISKATSRDMLERATILNPWVPEPHLLLAQLALIDGNYGMAEKMATRGLQILLDWGTCWDKRVPWNGWVAWARILSQRSTSRNWPKTLTEHNNLGLVAPPSEGEAR